jgi:hypothetical protein
MQLFAVGIELKKRHDGWLASVEFLDYKTSQDDSVSGKIHILCCAIS